VRAALRGVKRIQTTAALDALRVADNACSRFESRVRGTHDVLHDDLLSDDESMSHMYLSFLMMKPQEWYSDAPSLEHEQIELMLEHCELCEIVLCRVVFLSVHTNFIIVSFVLSCFPFQICNQSIALWRQVRG
jgi:hypothetical protein